MDFGEALYTIAYHIAASDGHVADDERAAIHLRLRSRGIHLSPETQAGLERRVADAVPDAIAVLRIPSERVDALSIAVEVAGIDRYLDGEEVASIQQLADRLLRP